MKPIKIALICNVGFEPYWYPLGISMLKENLERCTNVVVDNHYLSSEFSWYIDRYYPHLSEINAEIGEDGNCYHEIYFSTKLFNHADPRALIEKVFLDECNQRDIYRTRQAKATNLQKIPLAEEDFVEGVLEYCGLLDSFIDRKLGESEWHSYQLIGFSCLSSQLLCSVYMAKMIRRLGCKSPLVFGGGMFREWNVRQYAQLFPFVDKFVSGNGYQTILDIIRVTNRSLKVSSAATQNHYGDFSDVPTKVLRSHDFIFPVQLSEYCSWGRCLFCSIRSGAPRRISDKRVYDWMIKTSNEYGASDFGFVDSNLNYNMDKLGKLCSALAQSSIEFDLYGMLNTFDLTKQLCLDLKAAGFTFVLLGVENFSNSMLSRMKKRSTVLDNIKAIKWLVEAGIDEVVFNIIVDFPGVSKPIIQENLANIEMISHLMQTNVQCELVEFDLERDAKIYSLRKTMCLRGSANYDFDEICYPARIRHALKFHASKYKWFNFPKGWASVESALDNRRRTLLELVKKKGRFFIRDTRTARAMYPLTDSQFAIYKHICDNVSTLDDSSKQTGHNKQAVKSVLERFVSQGLAIKENNRYLGFALTP